MFTEVNKLF